ncbi:MAG: heavy-metal-associated domain-containing protein [Saprospiraceae bacterium]
MNIQFQVENIKCGGCAHTVTSSLKKIENIADVEVIIEDGLVNISGTNLDREQIAKKLHQLGYPEIGKGNTLTTATSYVSCMIGKVTK